MTDRRDYSVRAVAAGRDELGQLTRAFNDMLSQIETFLQRWLPFWLANLVERMWLALGIILAVLLPLSRVVPPLYTYRVRQRVFRWYARLRQIESRIEDGSGEPLEPLPVQQRVGDVHPHLARAVLA